MKLVVCGLFLMVSSFVNGQELTGKWYFQKGDYDSGKAHFGKRMLVFEGDACTMSVFKALAENFSDLDNAMTCAGSYETEGDQLTITFQDDCRISDNLTYSYSYKGDTLLIRNDEYQKNYYYTRQPE